MPWARSRYLNLPTPLDGRAGASALGLSQGLAIRHTGKVSRLRKIVWPFATALKLFSAASINLIARGIRAEIAYPGLRALTQAFYTAVRGAGPCPISAEDA